MYESNFINLCAPGFTYVSDLDTKNPKLSNHFLGFQKKGRNF
ncbi:hypothetical protein LEP1GSC203_0570 [Leptospira terpstrae serovar Hualin str. LT 11-33 = ATCC 700639]|uniref:Uncharacterized protein n=2 Tax=Leptospira TaxID=171 RepID=N1VUT6_9LEPT|nr:hypothetical protein LEP1GSC203_0570 [Leptospira terpstrae serovar Hualin str. LT 11-33 = ATCC 700639]EMY70896.1 hypothetical protein LEP1GSC199_0289 [Leptospira vanthielii serovar Holland str. Waz Holland = ATCC 700522]